MTAKHTPGPWEWACDSYGKVQHSRKYNCVFTTVKGNGGDRLTSIAARIENSADARLIAAAPDLLEACKAAQQALRATSQREKDYSHECGLLKTAIDKAS